MASLCVGSESAISIAEQVCCLIDNEVRCDRQTGNASYSKRIQKIVTKKHLGLSLDSESNVAEQRVCNINLSVWNKESEQRIACHIYICDHHKEIIQTARPKKKGKKTEDLPEEKLPVPTADLTARPKKTEKKTEELPEEKLPVPTVDLGVLQVSTLKRYKKHFNVTTKSGLNKAQLAEAMQAHFNTMEVDEKDVLVYFVYSVMKENEKRNPKSSLEDLADED